MRLNFFLYGSFSPGQVHYKHIVNLVKNQRTAIVRGDIYSLKSGYPALHVHDEGELVEGTLCELDNKESLWPLLDYTIGFDPIKPEKSLFVRREIQALVDNYSKVVAHTYCLNSKKITKSLRKIKDGFWRDELLKTPPLTQNLDIRQKDYIFKLSKSKGREIVPIKLDLYRELLSLGLIVDKGRRLALTPLGQELSLFLK
jgi:gamma-glutamylcyclotransferase (GGCT)/AIG2-like uncharacterized protein YtfP